MTATAKITINLDIDGLGINVPPIKDTYIDSATPETALFIPNQTQETADVAEALNVGAIDTLKGVWIRAVDGDILVDTSFVSTFSSELKIREGQSQYFEPTGTVYICNSTEGEQVIFDMAAWGEQD